MNNKFIPKMEGGGYLSSNSKNLIRSNSKKESIRVILFFIVLFFSFLPKQIWAQCPGSFSCNGGVNITVDENCTFNIHPSQFFTNYSGLSSSCKDLLHVLVTDENNNFIAQGSQVTIDVNTTFNLSIGDSIKVTVFEDTNGNNVFNGNEKNCWGGARVEDKSDPIIADCEDVSIFCFEELANVTGGSIVPVTATDNCSNNVSITLVDSVLTLVDCSVDPSIKATLVKTWMADDGFGNSETCTQTITILRFPTSGITITPPATAELECNSTNQPDTSVANLGYPFYSFDNNGSTENIELSPGNISGLCSDIKVIYEDTPSLGGMCGNEEKYLRSFYIFDCCANVFLDTVTQVIKLIDNTVPVLTCPGNLTYGTSSSSCTANVFIPAVGISDACNSSNFDVEVQSDFGNLNTNGGFINNFPVGIHTVTFIVNDACGNESMCSMTVTVIDNLAPIPICDESTVVALNNLGFATVGAMVFDDGSTDNCGIINYEVRRMASSCNLGTSFASSVDFACCDVGEVIMVELRLTDAAGNTNSCMVEVQVQDKQNPTIICPSNKVIECGSDTSAISLGMAFGVDNCGTANITWVNSGTLDPTCGTGTISRIWTVTDAQGQTTSCIQTIDVINSDPFSGNSDPNDLDDIQFPTDLTGADAISCIGYQNDPTLIDPSNTGEPILIGNISACSSVGTIIPTDLFLNMGTGDCSSVKIFRKWVVVDWCQAGSDPDLTQNGPGVWVHTQIVMVNDNDAPILLNAPADITISADANCQGSVSIPQILPIDIDDCSPNVSVTVTSPNLGGNGFGPFIVGLGSYSATYTLDDGCGNSTTHTINITIEDDKEPTPVCKEISSQLMPAGNGEGMLMLSAMTFENNMSSFDNCSSFDDLIFTVVFDSLNDPNVPPTATEILFTCDQLGTSSVALWACDQAGNCDFCVVDVVMTAPSGICGVPLSQLAVMSGLIDNEQGEGIDEVEVHVNNGQVLEMTNSNGSFNLNLPMYQNYNIKPGKNNTPLNGVTTFDIVKIRKHILGIELLDSPYKIIAGDVNNSGELTALDLAQIRNLILLNMNEFPNGVPSWRFVDANYVFSNPNDPLNETFPEAVDIQNLSTDLDLVDFVAIKVGDVTENASPNFLTNESREKKGELIFKTQNSKVKKGEEVSLIFETENEKDFSAWQFTLSFEQDLMKFIEVKKMEDVYFGNSIIEEGAITFSWDKTESAISETKLKWFEIRFIANKDLNIKDAIDITSNYTSAIAYDLNGGEYNVALQFGKERNEFENQEFRLFPNSPNPFENFTSINFYLPEEDNIEITVFDITGKLLRTYNSFYPKGEQHFILRKETNFSNGVLYYHVKTSKHQASGKMILLP
ncbi:MAG: HYR domain-containing protein [Saprospiraceae bacterium]